MMNKIHGFVSIVIDNLNVMKSIQSVKSDPKNFQEFEIKA